MVKDQAVSIDPLVGHQIGEYRIESVLGRGGMGVVYKAEDTNLGITVALKMIDPALARDASFVRRFRAEARAMARISSPHIVRVMAMRQTDHGLFIVMEYVDGGTLHDRMARGPMPWREVWPLASQILLALEQAHSVGVVHRDVKPRNIMLTANGTVKVTDFGLAKVVSDDPSVTVTQAVAGTLLYMSPEQVRAASDLDARSDLFALGLVLYEMLAGRLPFDRDAGEFEVMRAIVEEAFPPPTKHVGSVPAPVARCVMKALEKSPDRRYGSAVEMRTALGQLAPADEPGRVHAGGTPIYRRRPVILSAGGVLAVVLIAALILWGVLPAGSPPQVTGLALTSQTPSSVTLAWNPVRSATEYVVERQAGEQGEWRELRTIDGATTFTDFNLDEGTTYEYRIRARGERGAGSPSAPIIVQARGDGSDELARVTGLRVAERTGTTIELVWEPVAGAATYTVERSPDGTSDWDTRAEDQEESSFRDTGLRAGTAYHYRVHAVDSDGIRSQAAVVEATTARTGDMGATGNGTPAPGTLELTPVAGVTYSVGGRPAREAQTFPPGIYTVRCEAGGVVAETRATVRSGGTTSLTCHTERQVNVNATVDNGGAPWVSVVVNGEIVGQTPTRLNLRPGRHTISVQRDGFEVISPAETVEVRPSFEPSEPLRLSFRVRPHP